MVKSIAITLILTLASVLLFNPTIVLAQGLNQAPGTPCGRHGIEILPVWYKYVDRSVDSSGRCDLNFNFPDDLGLVFLAIVEILLRLSSMVAVAFVIVGGFRFITTQGEPEGAKSARQTIINGVIGLVIAILATGVVAFIGGQLTK